MRIDNPDNLPYYVVMGKKRVPVRFTTLEEGDDIRIEAFWPGAVYFDLWREIVKYAITRQTALKLTVADGRDDRILGLLRMGSGDSATGATLGLNTQSVLETAPLLQHRPGKRQYRGVGKVLVARLIAESIRRGRGGALVVMPRPKAIPFYLHLSFHPWSVDPKLFFIRQEQGVQLLQSVLIQE